MLRIGCLINSPSVIQDLTDQVKFYIHDALSNDKSVEAYNIWERMRKDKIEIDFESFGMLYDNIATQLDPTRALFTDIDDINKKAKKSFEAALGAVRTGTGKDKINEIGVDSPERFIGNAIARMLASSTSTTTLMAKLQKAVMAKTNEALGVKTTLSVVPQTAMEQMTNSIAKALELKRSNDTYGVLRQSITLIQAVDKELERMVDELNASGDHAQAAELQNLANQFKSSVTDFLLTKGETKVMAENMLKAMGFMKPNGAIKWDSILNHGAQEFVFSATEFDKNVRRMLNDPNLGLNVSPSEVDFIAQALTTKYKEIVTEKLAKEGKTTPGVIEKLIRYQALIDEQPDSAILQENYAATLTKALGLDDSHANGIAAATIELAQLFRALKDAKGLDTIIFRNLVDRKISLVLQGAKVTSSIAQHFFENMQAARSIALANAYNVPQNILSGITQAIFSGAIFNSNNWKGVWEAGRNYAAGGVDTVRGQQDINAQTEVRDRASATWRRGGKISNAIRTPLRVILGVMDVTLGMADAMATTFSQNAFINDAVEKYIKAKSTNPKQDLENYYKAFNDPARIAQINAEVDRIATALNMYDNNFKARLRNEMLRGTLVTETMNVNKNRMLIDASNIYSKMMHGKENNTSWLSFVPATINAKVEYLKNKAKRYRSENNTREAKAMMLIANTISWGLQWMAGAARWGVIAYDLSGMRLIEMATKGEWTANSKENIIEALNNSDKDKGTRLLAEYANKDSRRNMALIGLSGQILAAVLMVTLGDDDDDDDAISDKEGIKKLTKKIAMGFPVFYAAYAYAHEHRENKKLNAMFWASLDPFVSRYPTALDKLKNVKSGQDAAEVISDIYSINAYEALKSWYNAFVSEDKELKKRTKPTNIKEAVFHTGLMRTLFEPILVEEEDNRYIFKKKD